MKFIHSKKVIIRKEHRCCGCGEKYKIGEELEASVWVDEGRIYTTYLCKICNGFLDSLPMSERPDEWDMFTLSDWDGYEEFKKKYLVDEYRFVKECIEKSLTAKGRIEMLETLKGNKQR